jgi:hypothetical protein
MNIFLWALQGVFAAWTITGALYMMNHYEELASMWALTTLPSFAWTLLGILEILCALGLVVPGILKKSPKITVFSAWGLTALFLLGIVLYSSYTGSGILWAVIPALGTAFIAYKRNSSTVA